MGEAVVVLSPNSRCEEDIQRCNFLPPLNFEAFLDPLAVLVDHGVDDVNEWLVAVKQTMATGENVTFKPALIRVSNLSMHV
jgi:hypothetical protein